MKRDTEKRVVRAAMRLYNAPNCVPGTWASRCEHCKAERALERSCAAHAKQSRAKRRKR